MRTNRPDIVCKSVSFHSKSGTFYDFRLAFSITFDVVDHAPSFSNIQAHAQEFKICFGNHRVYYWKQLNTVPQEWTIHNKIDSARTNRIAVRQNKFRGEKTQR